MNRPRSCRTRFAALVLMGLLRVTGSTGADAPTSWYVDGGSPLCSDAGPGDSVAPFCTIQSAALRAAAGDTVLVRPAIYREQVTPLASGSPGAPVTYKALGPGTVVLGTLDASGAALWSPTATSAWSRPWSVSSKQVFLDGTRLKSAPSAAETTPGSYFFDAAVRRLYVDIGGPNPGADHAVEAGARTYGFNILGLSDIVIGGFVVKGHESVGVRTINAASVTLRDLDVSDSATYGIRTEAGAGPVTVENCAVSFSGSNGILLLNTTAVTVTGCDSHDNALHGILLQGSTRNIVAKNTCHANRNPLAREASGISLTLGSSENSVLANSVHSNQDSGINLYNGSNANLIARNVSYGNGDHGFDAKGVSTIRFVSNTAYGNYKDGFSIEGSSTDVALANNIVVDNGLLSKEFELFVDPLSTMGFTSDHDIFWKSSAGKVVKYDDQLYTSLSDFAFATGLEARGIDADPHFLDPVAGNFRLANSSPAIDSADAGAPGFTPADHDGFAPADDFTVADTGAGQPTFADRGAYENNPAPLVVLSLSPASGVIDLTVTADASASRDRDGGHVISFVFDFGDGTIVGPQSSPFATHTFTAPGTYTVTVTGRTRATASATALVRVDDSPPLVVLSLSVSGRSSMIITADASHSVDSDTTPIADYKFNFGDGISAGPQVIPFASHKYARRGAYRVTVTVTDTAGNSSRGTALVSVGNRLSSLRFAGGARK